MDANIGDDLRPISDFAKPGSNGYKRTYNRAKKYRALVLIGDIPYILMSKYSNGQLEDLKPQDESAKIEFHVKKYQKIRTIAKVNQIINKIQEGLERKYGKLNNLYDQLESEEDGNVKENINCKIEILANSTRDSELKLDAATKRKSEIETGQASLIKEVKKRLQERSDNEGEASDTETSDE